MDEEVSWDSLDFQFQSQVNNLGLLLDVYVCYDVYDDAYDDEDGDVLF